MLTFWQKKSRLLLIDFDEYIAMAPGKSLHTLTDTTYGILHLNRMNYYSDPNSTSDRPMAVPDYIRHHTRRELKVRGVDLFYNPKP